MARKFTEQETIEALHRIKEKFIEEGDDPEIAHIQADNALCYFLNGLGYTEIVKAYDEIQPKWYQ